MVSHTRKFGDKDSQTQGKVVFRHRVLKKPRSRTGLSQPPQHTIRRDTEWQKAEPRDLTNVAHGEEELVKGPSDPQVPFQGTDTAVSLKGRNLIKQGFQDRVRESRGYLRKHVQRPQTLWAQGWQWVGFSIAWLLAT